MGGDEWANQLKRYLGKDIKSVIFNWSGGISNNSSLNPASIKLVKFLKKYQDYNKIILFGKSLGGIVAEKAVKKLNSKNISKLIYVATPHKSSNIKFSKKLSIINIYSDADKYQKLANRILYFGFGKRFLQNSINFQIDNLGHSEFNYNKKVLINGKKHNLFDFYKNIIL